MKPMLSNCWFCILMSGLMLIAVGRAMAQQEAATTPMSLVELLPEDGGGGLPERFVLIRESPAANVTGVLESWEIERDEAGIRINTAGVLAGLERCGSRVTRFYDPAGNLVSYYRRNEIDPSWYSEFFGNVVGDTLVIKRRSHNPHEKGGATTTTQRLPVDRDDHAIHDAWLPLALGYHMREGHADFLIRLRRPGYDASVKILSVQDIGTEHMEVHGQRREVHVLVASVSFESLPPNVGPIEQDINYTMQLRCLPTGQIVQQRDVDEFSDPPYELLYQSITLDQVREQFGDDVATRLVIDQEDKDQAQAADGGEE